MTLSVGFRAPSHQEIFAGFTNYLDNITCAEDRYSDPDLKRQANPGEINQEAISRVPRMIPASDGARKLGVRLAPRRADREAA